MVGVIQFDPKEGRANDKDVRNITVQQAGFGPTAVKVSATVWPSHAHIPLKKGDVVALEGSYTQKKSSDDDGNERTFHNLSVTRLALIASVDEGSRTETVNTSEAVADDEDIPF